MVVLQPGGRFLTMVSEGSDSVSLSLQDCKTVLNIYRIVCFSTTESSLECKFCYERTVVYNWQHINCFHHMHIHMYTHINTHG